MVTFLGAAGLLVAAAGTIIPWPLYDVRGLSRESKIAWPEPTLGIQPEPDVGPILVSTTYVIAREHQRGFLDGMERLRLSRLRTGAIRWELYQDGETPTRFLEVYTVPSWEEHLRQHHGRLTGTDVEIERDVARLSEPAPETRHLFPAG
jgi:hypothetical protein